SDPALRDASEQSGFLLRQALNRLPAILMHARLLDFFVKKEIASPTLPPSSPDATDWLNLLGSFLNGSHEEARYAERFFRGTGRALRN
ncbi:hypothetical protein, partial [Stenotrophomonas maltophilia]|uniref:hypothetical protein n=1 Tax=Stenotrophomonas maltophilia TaxID=40324 RepID=UPI001953D255